MKHSTTLTNLKTKLGIKNFKSPNKNLLKTKENQLQTKFENNEEIITKVISTENLNYKSPTTKKRVR